MINFPITDLNQVLRIYQQLINRTVLRPATLPSSTITLKTVTPLTKYEAIFVFTATLAVNGLSVRPLGDKFVFVCPTFETNKLNALLARRMPEHDVDNTTLPPGAGGMPSDLKQLLHLYGEMCGQHVENTTGQDGILILCNQTPLTKTEALYAMDLLLGWEGLEVIPDEEGKGLKLVRAQ